MGRTGKEVGDGGDEPSSADEIESSSPSSSGLTTAPG